MIFFLFPIQFQLKFFQGNTTQFFGICRNFYKQIPKFLLSGSQMNKSGKSLLNFLLVSQRQRAVFSTENSTTNIFFIFNLQNKFLIFFLILYLKGKTFHIKICLLYEDFSDIFYMKISQISKMNIFKESELHVQYFQILGYFYFP